MYSFANMSSLGATAISGTYLGHVRPPVVATIRGRGKWRKQR
jgi:hypothetical protein